MSRLARLHAVTDREILERSDFVELAARLLRAGPLALHLRARGSNGRLLLDRSRELCATFPETAILVNDRVDVARIAGAGAHLPEAGLTPAQARTILGPGPLLGRSVHTPEAAGRRAAELDFLVYGHVFPTPSKPDLAPRGTSGLTAAARAASRVGLPLIAVGGVTPGRVGLALAAGAYGVAAVSGIWDAADPGAAAEAYLQELERGMACSSP
ncbi:MAG: thiamine phosphate synthase [Gemmatimonadota bacterium]